MPGGLGPNRFRVATAAALAALLAACSLVNSADASRTAASPAPPAPTSAHGRNLAPVASGLGGSTRLRAPVTRAVVLPPTNVGFDYQLGGAYPPAVDVVVVGRDRTDVPVAGLYNVCYVNGFQTQPGESAWWNTTHPSLLLRNANGTPVIDPEWPDEYILDVSTSSNRTAIAAIVGPWIAGCATSGFNAVEVDNLDTFTRFSDRFSADDAVAMMGLYSSTAHQVGLAVAQKNSAELVERRGEMSLDFSVVEQCGQYEECDAFTAAYGPLVFAIEYQRAAFTQLCVDHPELSVVLRDVDLVAPTDAGYVRDAC